MAKNVQIRNVPDALHRELRTRATRAGRSLSDYLLEELTRVGTRPEMADLMARAADRARRGRVDHPAVLAALDESRRAHDDRR
jgi:plasmid stability protein